MSRDSFQDQSSTQRADRVFWAKKSRQATLSGALLLAKQVRLRTPMLPLPATRTWAGFQVHAPRRLHGPSRITVWPAALQTLAQAFLLGIRLPLVPIRPPLGKTRHRLIARLGTFIISFSGHGLTPSSSSSPPFSLPRPAQHPAAAPASPAPLPSVSIVCPASASACGRSPCAIAPADRCRRGTSPL